MGVALPSLAILAETQTLEAQLLPGLLSCLVLLSLLAQSEEEGAAFFSARQFIRRDDDHQSFMDGWEELFLPQEVQLAWVKSGSDELGSA